MRIPIELWHVDWFSARRGALSGCLRRWIQLVDATHWNPLNRVAAKKSFMDCGVSSERTYGCLNRAACPLAWNSSTT